MDDDGIPPAETITEDEKQSFNDFDFGFVEKDGNLIPQVEDPTQEDLANVTREEPTVPRGSEKEKGKRKMVWDEEEEETKIKKTDMVWDDSFYNSQISDGYHTMNQQQLSIEVEHQNQVQASMMNPMMHPQQHSSGQMSTIDHDQMMHTPHLSGQMATPYQNQNQQLLRDMTASMMSQFLQLQRSPQILPPRITTQPPSSSSHQRSSTSHRRGSSSQQRGTSSHRRGSSSQQPFEMEDDPILYLNTMYPLSDISARSGSREYQFLQQHMQQQGSSSQQPGSSSQRPESSSQAPGFSSSQQPESK